MIVCPDHKIPLTPDLQAFSFVCSRGCQFPSAGPGVIDLLSGRSTDQTGEHYSLQWGPEVDFASFGRAHPEALPAMTSKQMGWPNLVRRIRARAEQERVLVLDAGCGYGALFLDLFEQVPPPHLAYLGADVHGALSHIPRPTGIGSERATFVRWDISQPVPSDEVFDFVICRAAIHHTPDPAVTFRSLVSQLAPGGTIAITVYARKSPMREAVDDDLRARVVPMSPRQAFTLARQFTLLGRDLQASEGAIEIAQDLPFLGIKAGRYKIQEFIYDHFMKCWFNSAFGERYSDIVNFDWYHPPYAYRYQPNEIVQWFEQHGLVIDQTVSIKAQHYFEGRRLS